MFSTIIIDDERIARNRIKRLLDPFDQIEIISEAENGKIAIKEIDDLKPDLIFLDIQMPEFNGFQVLEQITHMPKIIFTTAYDQYALKAFEANSIDYLMKPIEKDRLESAIFKLKRLSSDEESSYSSLINYVQQEKIDQITVRFGDKVVFIDLDEISYFQSKEKAVELRTLKGDIYIIDYTLQLLEDKLEKGFIRIHRSFLINKKKIKEATRLGNGKYEFTMKDNIYSKLNSSIGYSENIKQLFSL